MRNSASPCLGPPALAGLEFRQHGPAATWDFAAPMPQTDHLIRTAYPAGGMLSLPQIEVQGGSKWRRFFGRACQVQVASAEITALRHALAGGDEHAAIAGPAGALREETVFLLGTGEALAIGAFLIGPLAVFFAQGQAVKGVKLCGGRLTRRQTDVLAQLGLLRDYLRLEKPAAFDTVLTPVPGEAVSVPGPHVRLLADRLRGAAVEPSAALAILPPRESERFSLANRASLVAWLRAKRITVFEPESAPWEETVRMLASARLVLLADPAQAGLLGLCAPGCKILELTPEGWASPAARCLSLIFGLDWTIFLAAPPGYPLIGSLPFGARVPLSYEISIRDLALSLEAFA